MVSILSQEEFFQACVGDRQDIVDSMLADGHVPSTKCLTVACKRGDQVLVQKLLKVNNIDAQPGFMEAVRNNHFHLLDHLYTSVDINKPGMKGMTALHVSVDGRSPVDLHVTKWLLDMGANQMPDDYGVTPLHDACINSGVDLVKLLLEYKTDYGIHFPNNYGYTPLHFACMKGRIEIVELLLQHMTSYGQTLDKLGNTPLHYACRDVGNVGNVEIVRLLLQDMTTYGKDQTRTPNNEGITPLDLAKNAGNPELVSLLELQN